MGQKAGGIIAMTELTPKANCALRQGGTVSVQRSGYTDARKDSEKKVT